MELCQSKKHIAIFSSLNYHYEMFGYIINFCSLNDYKLTIFTDNIKSTITKLQNFLNAHPNDFHKFVWRLNYDNSIVQGYKIMYKEPENELAVEFSIYDEKYKDGILNEHNGKRILPFFKSYKKVNILKMY